MFTGLIESRGVVVSREASAAGVRLVVEPRDWAHGAKFGESIAISGCCLTVAEQPTSGSGPLVFDVIGETLDRTTLGGLEAGSEVNLEASLRVGDRMGGHFVQGHVDAVVEVVEVQRETDDWRVRMQLPRGLEVCFAPKGSVTVEGVSLTIAAVDEGTFEVALIPTTLELTTLGSLELGSRVNIETDILARTVVETMRRMGAVDGGGAGRSNRAGLSCEQAG